MVFIEVPAPIAAIFSFCQGLGEPDWRCSKTGDCMLLSIRWNSKVSVAAENVATGNRQPKEPNSRQRRSKRRLETFIARKSASTEAADGPSSRTPEREQPRRQDHRNAQAENASSTLPPVSYADSIKRTLSRSTSSACQFASKLTAKGSEDAIVHKKDNDDAMSRLCNAPSGTSTCTTFSDGPTTRKITSSATPPGSSLTQLGVQSRTCTKESLFDDDDIKSFSKEMSQAILEGLRRSLSESVDVQQANDSTASPPRKKPPKPWR